MSKQRTDFNYPYCLVKNGNKREIICLDFLTLKRIGTKHSGLNLTGEIIAFYFALKGKLHFTHGAVNLRVPGQLVTIDLTGELRMT